MPQQPKPKLHPQTQTPKKAKQQTPTQTYTEIVICRSMELCVAFSRKGQTLRRTDRRWLRL